LARREDCRINAGPSPSFARRVEQAGLPTHTLVQIEPLLVMLKALNEQIKVADKRLEEIARGDEVVQRLCSVPGVGPVFATTFASTLDDSSRFLGAKHVRSHGSDKISHLPALLGHRQDGLRRRDVGAGARNRRQD
jgi:transposase